MKALKIEADGTLRLPKKLMRRLGKSRDFLVWADGDTIVVKRIASLNPSQFAEREPAPEIPIEDIAAEVHKLRREKRGRRG